MNTVKALAAGIAIVFLLGFFAVICQHGFSRWTVLPPVVQKLLAALFAILLTRFAVLAFNRFAPRKHPHSPHRKNAKRTHL